MNEVNEVLDGATRAELDRLRAAIRRHRDARGDDRCWLDDLVLYGALDDGGDRIDTALPPKCAFLESCARFWDQRQRPADRAAAASTARRANTMTIRQMEDEIERLREALIACTGSS